ncbi:MAG: YitT family protein [Desulfovibrionaceae bacterium]
MSASVSQQPAKSATAYHQAALPAPGLSLSGGGLPEWLVPFDAARSQRSRMGALTRSTAWNLMLLTVGAVIYALALNAIAIPHGLITGGASGLGLLCYYLFGGLDAPQWVLLFNLPLYVVGYVFVSRRFFWYSLYGMVCTIAAMQCIHYTAPIQDPWTAVLTCGALMGVGWGVALNSLGSLGGFDILAVLLHRKFNISMGGFNIVSTVGIFAVGLAFWEHQAVLYSLFAFCAASMVMERCLGLLNQRKLVLVVSDTPEAIAKEASNRLHIGCTMLNGQSAYTGDARKVLLIAIHTMKLKQLEEIIYDLDPNAFTVTQSTLNVLGSRFSTPNEN